MPANALSSATWSAMLAHRRVDRRPGHGAGRPQRRRSSSTRASFFASAVLHRADAVRLDAAAGAARSPGWLALTGIPDLLEGLRYVRQHAHVAALMFVKAGWGLAGGVLLLLTIFGQRVFPVGGEHGRRHRRAVRRARRRRRRSGRLRCAGFSASSRAALRRTIGPAYFMVGVFYVALAGAPTLLVAAASASCCAHFGGSILWVFSTVLLQLEVPDRFRGRVFAAELALVTLTSSIVELLDRLRARSAPAGRRAGCRSRSA